MWLNKNNFSSLIACLLAWQLINTGSVCAEPNTISYQISSPIRMSEWLRINPLTNDQDVLGVIWSTPEETVRQMHEQLELFKLLEQSYQKKEITKFQLEGLQHRLSQLSPTGRVPTSFLNSAWLEANPKRDPMLKTGDLLKVAMKTTRVFVMGPSGDLCAVPYRFGSLALNYVTACQGVKHSWAWVIQPDGKVHKVGVEVWNTQQQPAPSPGAWIWYPSSDLAEGVSQKWAQWLANQGNAETVILELNEQFSRQPKPNAVEAGALEMVGRNLTYSPTSSDWGNAGLLQTPTARMRKPGYFGLGMHRVQPYEQVNVFMQPTSWLETGFRYASINNRLYSPYESFSGSQAYKDKSIDVKLKVWSESDWIPEIALGIRDVGGTGLFSSEYIVGSKRFGRLDFTAGLAWGYLGNKGNLQNPLSKFGGSKFDKRVNEFGLGGNFAGSTWFHGPAATFGGVEYQSPWSMSFKLEYDGNNYKRDPLGNSLKVKSSFNYGIVYNASSIFDLRLGYERGNTLSLGFTVFTDFNGPNFPKLTDPPLPAVIQKRSSQNSNWAQTAGELEKHTQWTVEGISRKEDLLVVDVSRSLNPAPQVRLDKAITVLHRDAPQDVENFEVRHRAAGDTLAIEKVNRSEWVDRQLSPPRTQEKFEPKQPTYIVVNPTGEQVYKRQDRPFYFEPGLDFIQTLGGPEGFVLYQLSAAARVGLKLPKDVQINGLFRGRVMSNYEKFKIDFPSRLPRVRTDLRKYMVTSEVTMTSLSISKSSRLSRNWYVAGYAGYFEEMFGGIGSEILYREPASRWAMGLDVNNVRQRKFEQDFSFQDYRVNTGHLTTYWETPFDGVFASVAFGKYLAGDKGKTYTITKVFRNGSTMGAYMTRTNVAAEVFGEGSFDKGIFWSIPFDSIATSSSRSHASMLWRPMLRDGGARVARPVKLFYETYWLSPEANRYLPSPPANKDVPPDDRQ